VEEVLLQDRKEYEEKVEKLTEILSELLIVYRDTEERQRGDCHAEILHFVKLNLLSDNKEVVYNEFIINMKETNVT
jgi:hypothetical protein